MDLGLQDQPVIVTGAGTGIGEAVAKRFAKEGARVVCAGLPGDPIEAVAREIEASGGTATPFGGDLSEEGAAEACVRHALDTFGGLYCLAHVAGVFQATGEHQDLSVADMDYYYRHHVRSALLLTKYALPALREAHGNLVYTGSETAVMGQPEAAVYGGVKGYLAAFARGVAFEQAKHGVRANVVCPGPTMTQWHDPAVSSMTEEMESKIKASVPLGRHASPEEVANVYAFLASVRASFVTGALYFVDGGISVTRGTPGEAVPDDVKRHHERFLELELRHQMEGMEAMPEGVRPHRAA